MYNIMINNTQLNKNDFHVLLLDIEVQSTTSIPHDIDDIFSDWYEKYNDLIDSCTQPFYLSIHNAMNYPSISFNKDTYNDNHTISASVAWTQISDKLNQFEIPDIFICLLQNIKDIPDFFTNYTISIQHVYYNFVLSTSTQYYTPIRLNDHYHKIKYKSQEDINNLLLKRNQYITNLLPYVINPASLLKDNPTSNPNKRIYKKPSLSYNYKFNNQYYDLSYEYEYNTIKEFNNNIYSSLYSDSYSSI